MWWTDDCLVGCWDDGWVKSSLNIRNYAIFQGGGDSRLTNLSRLKNIQQGRKIKVSKMHIDLTGSNKFSVLIPALFRWMVSNSRIIEWVRVICIDKVYIDGPCDISRCFVCAFRNSESRDSLLWIGPIEAVSMQYGWALEFPNSNVCSTIEPDSFLITKNFRVTIYPSIPCK